MTANLSVNTDGRPAGRGFARAAGRRLTCTLGVPPLSVQEDVYAEIA